MTYPLDARKKTKKTFIPRLAYGTIGLGLSVVPALSVACSSGPAGDTDPHVGTDAVYPAISVMQDANPADGVGVRLDPYDAAPVPTDAVFPYIPPDGGPDGEATDEASDDASDAEGDAGDAALTEN